jgi:hypothetical protein
MGGGPAGSGACSTEAADPYNWQRYGARAFGNQVLAALSGPSVCGPSVHADHSRLDSQQPYSRLSEF